MSERKRTFAVINVHVRVIKVGCLISVHLKVMYLNHKVFYFDKLKIHSIFTPENQLLKISCHNRTIVLRTSPERS